MARLESKAPSLLQREGAHAGPVDVAREVVQSLEPGDDDPHDREPEPRPREVHRYHPLDASRSQALQLPADVGLERVAVERRHVVKVSRRTVEARSSAEATPGLVRGLALVLLA